MTYLSRASQRSEVQRMQRRAAPSSRFLLMRALAATLAAVLAVPMVIGSLASPASAESQAQSTIEGKPTFNVAFYETRHWEGSLLSEDKGIANATLDVTLIIPGAPNSTSTVTTDEHGVFSVPVAQWSPVDSAHTGPGSIEIAWSGNEAFSGSQFTVDLIIEPIDAVGMTVTHDAGDRGTADNPLPLGTEVTYDIYVAAARAGGQQHVTVEYSDPAALYRTKTEDVVLTDGHAQVALPVMRPGTAARSDDRYVHSLHSISYSYLNDMRPEFVAEFVSELQGAKYTRGFIFDWENEGYDAPVDGVIYQERGNDSPGTLLAHISALEYPELSKQGYESVSVTWAWVTEDELDRALTGDFNGLDAGMMQNSGNPPSVYINVPKVTGAEPLYLVATATAYSNVNTLIADMEPRVVLSLVRDPSPIVPDFSLDLDPAAPKAGEVVEFRTRLRDSDLNSPIRGTVSIHAEGTLGDRVIAQSATADTMSGDKSTQQTLRGTVPFGTTRIHAEFEPADDFPWSAATQTSPLDVTVASSAVALQDVAPIHPSLLTDTAIELELDKPLTTTATYQFDGAPENYAAPITGSVEFVNGHATLTLPRATAPYHVPHSLVISPEPGTGVTFVPVSVTINPVASEPLTLNGPETTVAGVPTRFSATYAKAPQDSEDDLTIEIYTGSGPDLNVIASAPALSGAANLSASLPTGTQQLSVRLVRDGTVLQDLRDAHTVTVSKQKASIIVPPLTTLSAATTTRVEGNVLGASGPATSGTITYQLTGLVGKHEGSVDVSSNGTFNLSLPASFEKKDATLRITYVPNNGIHEGAEYTITVKPDPRLTNASITLKATSTAYAGQKLTLAAGVTDAGKKSVSGGNVTFYHVVNGKRVALGTSPVKSGTASLSVTPAAGTQSYVAVFSGSGTSAMGESPSFKVNVTATLTSVKVTMSGKAAIGSKLTARATTNTSAKVSYQWHASGIAIKGATQSTYTVKKDDVGKKITVKVTAAQGAVTRTVTSAATSKVSKSATTVTVSAPKTVKLKKTFTVKVKVKTPSLTKASGTLKVKAGKKTYTKKITEPGTYTFKIKASTLGKGTKKVTTTLTLTKSAKKYSATPSKKTVKVKVT